MDLFRLRCLKCGHSFGLSSNKLFEMKSCSCLHCGQEMAPWQFYDLKLKFYKCVEMQRKVLSGIGASVSDPHFFTFEVAGDESEPEDVRLLKYIFSIYEEERNESENPC